MPSIDLPHSLGRAGPSVRPIRSRERRPSETPPQTVHRSVIRAWSGFRERRRPVSGERRSARLLTLSDLTRTEQGAAFGTPKYFAPEQFRGTKRDIDNRTDLFALGIMLYEALVGQHPFYVEGMTYDELAESVCVRRDTLNVEGFTCLDDRLQLLVRRLLAADRVSRINTAKQVAAILRKIGRKK